MNTTDIARHLSLEPHDDEPDLTPVERQARALLRIEYDAWRRDNPFSDVLDWSLHLAALQSVPAHLASIRSTEGVAA